MHLYANSMNVLSRLHSVASGSRLVKPAASAQRPPLKSTFALHLMGEDGSMSSELDGAWDGDARRPRARNTPRMAARQQDEVPVAPENLQQENIHQESVPEPCIFWG